MGKLTTDFDNYPGHEQFMVTINDYGVTAGKYLYFDLPFTPSLIGPGANQRTLPLYISQNNKDIIRTEVDLPSDFPRVLIAPQNADYTVAGSEKASVQVGNTFNDYIVTDQLITTPAIISPDTYQTILKVESDLSRKSSKVFLLEQK